MTAYGLAVLDALQVLHTSWCDQMMVCITSLGNAGAVWIVFAVVLLLRRRTRAIGIYCILALLLSFLCCNLILKPLLMRPRPFLFSDVELLHLGILPLASFPLPATPPVLAGCSPADSVA